MRETSAMTVRKRRRKKKMSSMYGVYNVQVNRPAIMYLLRAWLVGNPTDLNIELIESKVDLIIKDKGCALIKLSDMFRQAIMLAEREEEE